MLGTLEFNTDEEFEENKFKRAVNADAAYLALYEIKEHLIKEAKERPAAQDHLQKLNEIMIDLDVNLDILE